MVAPDAQPVPPVAAVTAASPAPEAPQAPPTPSKRKPRLSHRLEYGALRVAIGFFGLLGWDRASAAGGIIGSLGYWLGIRRRVAMKQIAAAFPELTPRQVRQIALGSYMHLGRLAVETALLSRLTPDDLLARFEPLDWERWRSVLDRGKGAIVLTGHLGNWELSGGYIAARGVPVDAVVRSMGNPLFDAYITRTRSRLGLRVVRDREVVRRTPKTLAANEVVGFLADQSGIGLASALVPFFGRPAWTPRGPAVFALRTGAPVFIGAAIRQSDGRFRIEAEELPVVRTGNTDEDVAALLERYSHALERYIRLAPEQYFWQHKRWKRQPADTPAHLRDPVEE